jgi:hypothetical protein
MITTKSPAAAAVVDSGISLKFRYDKPIPSSFAMCYYPPMSFDPRLGAELSAPVGDVKKVPSRNARLDDDFLTSSSVRFPISSVAAGATVPVFSAELLPPPKFIPVQDSTLRPVTAFVPDDTARKGSMSHPNAFPIFAPI